MDMTDDKKNKIPAALVEALIKVRGDADFSKVVTADAFPIRKSIKGDAYKGAIPGQMIAGEGIFLGKYEPKDKEGKKLGLRFNVFAAPEDLTNAMGKKDTFRYTEALQRINDLKDFHGYNGERYENDSALFTALKNGSYKGGWVIPPCELLIGYRIGEEDLPSGGVETVQADNLFDHKSSGAFGVSFYTDPKLANFASTQYYWSCTELRYKPEVVFDADLKDGSIGLSDKTKAIINCRLVRLVPC